MNQERYYTVNLWFYFREAYPITSRIPFIGKWSFGSFCKAYWLARKVTAEV